MLPGRSASDTPFLTSPPDEWVIIGRTISSTTTTFLTANTRYYYRLLLTKPARVKSLSLLYTTNPNPGEWVRMAVATATEGWQPDTILAESGQIDTTAGGRIVWNLPSPLTLFERVLYILQTGPITSGVVRVWSGGLPVFVTTTTGGVASFTRIATGPIDTTPWDTMNAGGVENIHLTCQLA